MRMQMQYTRHEDFVVLEHVGISQRCRCETQENGNMKNGKWKKEIGKVKWKMENGK
jgi:hypothetical protein